LGDVLIPDLVVDYELQKLKKGEASIRWRVHNTSERLLIAARSFTKTNWRKTRSRRPNRQKPNIYFGPICTGNKVIADESLTKKFRHVWEKLIGVEMEAGGVANAASQAANGLLPGI
jgi:nucleoside phosphorylase